MASLALFANVADRRCLVVGAGPVAARKIEALVRAGAPVRVVAPEAVDSVRDHAEAGRIDYQARDFREEDLEGVFLVVIASSDAALNDKIAEEARGRGLLVNAAHKADAGDVLLPSVIRRDPIQVAICTDGASPVLGRLLRNHLESRIPGAFGRLAAFGREIPGRGTGEISRAPVAPPPSGKRS